MPIKPLFFLVLLGVAAFGHAQGSAAGYGQGGGQGGMGGGGMGGGFGGNVGGEAPATHPEDEPGDDDRLYETRTAILTPGDRVEYKLKVEKGTTLFAGATSEAFDPALQVEDAGGKVLAKNDDREEGDQAPFVAVRFSEAGTYTLKVMSFRQASGGKFTLKLRTFVAQDAPLGRSFHESSGGNSVPRLVLRVPAKKGVVYSVRTWPAGRNGVLPSLVRIVGPTGVGRNDLERFPTPDVPLFKASADGDYYFDYRVYGQANFNADVKVVPVTSMGLDDEKSFNLTPGEFAAVEFPVEPKRIVQTSLEGGNVDYRMIAPNGEPDNVGGGDQASGASLPWIFFRLDKDSDRDVVRIFRGSGTARVVLWATAGTPQKATLRNATKLPEWPAGEVRGKLAIGETRLYRLDSAKSELMRVAASSPTFKPRLDIYRLDGALVNTLPNRTKNSAADDLYFPEAAPFLVRLSCEGFGGSGDFTLKRDTPAAVPYALGATQTLALDGTNFGLYTVELEAGKRYQFTVDHPERYLRVDLLDEDGTFLQSQGLNFETVSVQYFVPAKSGRHRLWLRGGPGERRFKLEPHSAPKVGP